MDSGTLGVWGNKLIDICTELGIKIVVALLILIIGRLVIKKLMDVFGKMKAIQKMDPAVQSFLLNFIKIGRAHV